MKKDTEKTDVIFRVDKYGQFKGDVVAYFPHEVFDSQRNIMCYMHVGQHSSANYLHCIGKTRLATEEEAKYLKRELEGIGYNLNVIKKQNYRKFLKSVLKMTDKEMDSPS